MSDGPLTSVLVTGGHGLIGRHVVAELARRGVRVIAPHRTGEKHGMDVHTPELDLEDTDGLAALLDDVDAVVHLAARSGGIQFQDAGHAVVLDDNRRITRSVLAACRAAGVDRAFLASSGVVYAPSDRPISEDHAVLRPEDRPSGYAWSKLSDEAAAHWEMGESGLEAVVGRFSNVYGPGASFDPSRSTVVHALVRRAAEAGDGATLTVWGDGSAVRSFLAAPDAARAVVTVVERGQPGAAYNIDSGVPVSIGELAREVVDVVNPTLQLEFDASKPSGQPVRVLDIARLRSLGFEPSVGLREGIGMVLQAWRDSPEAG